MGFILMCLGLVLAAVVHSADLDQQTLCVFTDQECSCSRRPQIEDEKCVSYSGVDKLGGPECTTGACHTERFTCDCLDPTHLCSRTTCTHWKALDQILEQPFKCRSEKSSCVQQTRVLPQRSMPPATAAVTTTQVTTTPTTTTMAPTAAPTTTTLAPITTQARRACQFPCPKCYVPSSGCDKCILNPSMTPTEAAECNPCEDGGEAYCGPMFGLIGNWQCCPPESVCKHDVLPGRGIGRAAPHLICSQTCGSDCDNLSNGLCSPFGMQSLGNDAVGKQDDIGDCSWQEL